MMEPNNPTPEQETATFADFLYEIHKLAVDLRNQKAAEAGPDVEPETDSDNE